MTKTLIDEDIVAFRGLLHDTLGQSIVDAEQFHFDVRNPQHLLTISLYATILQSAHDCSILLGEETVTIVGGALRSIVESCVNAGIKLDHFLSATSE